MKVFHSKIIVLSFAISEFNKEDNKMDGDNSFHITFNDSKLSFP